MKAGILVPYDGSSNASEALRIAVMAAKLFNEKVIVLNVQPSFRTIHTKMFFSDNAIREYQEQLFHQAVEPAETFLKDANVEYEIKLRTGDAKEQILREAKGDESGDNNCSNTGVRSIIMGSRGMNPIVGGVLGSVSYGVVNAAPCPVTIIPYSC